MVLSSQDKELIEKLTELLGLPQYIRSVDISLRMDEEIKIKCEFLANDSNRTKASGPTK